MQLFEFNSHKRDNFSSFFLICLFKKMFQIKYMYKNCFIEFTKKVSIHLQRYIKKEAHIKKNVLLRIKKKKPQSLTIDSI
jgi:hypothetical protein